MKIGKKDSKIGLGHIFHQKEKKILKIEGKSSHFSF